MKTYRNRPIIRKDNIIYYGSMADKNIIMLQILSEKEGICGKVADKILVQMQLTDENALPQERIIKATEKNGLAEALDISDIWLSRANKA